MRQVVPFEIPVLCSKKTTRHTERLTPLAVQVSCVQKGVSILSYTCVMVDFRLFSLPPVHPWGVLYDLYDIRNFGEEFISKRNEYLQPDHVIRIGKALEKGRLTSR